MAWQDVKIGVVDNEGDKGWTGFGINVNTPGNFATTYIPYLNAHSDGLVGTYKTTATVNTPVNPSTLTGEHVERVGTVELYNDTLRRRIKLQILAISDADVSKPMIGQDGSEAVIDATVAGLVGAFITDSGLSAADWRVIGNYISERRR